MNLLGIIHRNRKRCVLISLLAVCSAAVVLIVSGVWRHPVISDIDVLSGEDGENLRRISLNTVLSNADSDVPESVRMDRIIEKFLWRYRLKGASLAVVSEGKLVYAKGYGWADETAGVLMSPGNVFRLASLSKLITAAAVMKLCESGLLNLDEHVFGPGALLDYPEFADIRDPRMMKITVRMLLEHTAGFSRRLGDPMFTTRDVMARSSMSEVPDMDAMIRYALSQRLGYVPGRYYKYSNLGYLVLTKVVEHCSGMDYEAYCQRNVLYPAGCYDMHLAHNFYEEKYPNEVRYYEQDNELVNSYDLHKDGMYPRTYGGSNVAGLLGAGAWVGSPAEYVRFIASIDGDDVISDVLGRESVLQMTETSDSSPHPLGWVNSAQGMWTRTGTLAGVSAMARRMPDGTIWMFITNTSNWQGSKFTRYISKMMTDAFSTVRWPSDRDLFEKQDP